MRTQREDADDGDEDEKENDKDEIRRLEYGKRIQGISVELARCLTSGQLDSH